MDASGPRVRVAQTDGTARLILRGELDLEDADDLNRAVTHVVGTEAHTIDIEMGRLDFIGTDCMGILARLGWEAKVRAKHVRLLHPNPPVALVLRLTGLDQSFGLNRAN